VYTFYPNNPYLARPTSMSAAQTHAQQRSLHDEILEHEAVVQLDPTNAEAWRRLGLLQQENERDAAAIAAFRNAIRHAPHGVPTGDTRIALAVAYANENCLGDAYKELENWIVEHPIYGRAAGKAPIYDETIQDRHTRVEQAMIRAVQSRPDVLDAELQAALGVLFNLAGEPQKAMDCFRAAVQARPADHLLWNRLGASLAHAGQFPEALDAYRQALELRPGYVRARYNIGIACINLNLYREAAEHLLTALALQLPKIEPGQSTAPVSGTMPSTATTDSLWRALKMTMNLLERPDLAAHCDDRNLNAFRNDFEF
jgi:peroxin-5